MNPLEMLKQSKALLKSASDELTEMLKVERSRKRGNLMHMMHEISLMQRHGSRFYSQSGQDRVVDGLLHGKAGGTFVDIGGYNGVTGSNTLFFEQFRNWSGILVEAAPLYFEHAKALRRCKCLKHVVAGTEASTEFMEVTGGYTQMSGMLEKYDTKLLETVRKNEAHKETMRRFKSKTLASILTKAKLGPIDFLSLDVEGAEMDILSTFPFSDFDIDIWCIENNAQSSDLPTVMKDNGYRLIEFVGVDDIYRK